MWGLILPYRGGGPPQVVEGRARLFRKSKVRAHFSLPTTSPIPRGQGACDSPPHGEGLGVGARRRLGIATVTPNKVSRRARRGKERRRGEGALPLLPSLSAPFPEGESQTTRLRVNGWGWGYNGESTEPPIERRTPIPNPFPQGKGL